MDVSHLHVGQRIEVGKQYARDFSYEPVIGKIGVIYRIATHHSADATGHRRKKKHPVCSVRIEEKDGGTWFVQAVDCIPANTTNKTNAHLLSQDFQ